MFENDPVPMAQSKPKKKPKRTEPMGIPIVGKRDEFIMDTNNSSIVSKRSVEKLYHPGQPEYFRYFVRKFQRRSPLINRGYWLRMKAIEKTVSRFLHENSGKTQLVVNLGCGYDPLPFQFLGIYPEQCKDCVFVDVDYPQLMRRKLEVIKSNRPLLDLIPDLVVPDSSAALLASSRQYKALGCNLNDVSSLDKALRENFDLDSASVAIIFVAEVSVAYMERHAADAVLSWAGKLRDARFCLLEQHLPDGADHPFAHTMLRHFEKLRTPLHAIGTIGQMRERFVSAGWNRTSVLIKTLWDLWSDPAFLSADERQALDRVEPFDEWEEFALFGSHYFLLDARTSSAIPFTGHDALNNAGIKSSPKQSEWVSKTIGAPTNKRRFAAVAENCAHEQDKMALSHCGGLGSQERLKTADVYCIGGSPSTAGVTELPAPLMCHTLTTIKPLSPEVLLVGGRTSPDKPSAACWVFDGQAWEQVETIPTARYRHCAVGVVVDSQEPHGLSGVLVFGGKATAGRLLCDCWFFDRASGWKEVTIQITEPLEPRFGASMATDFSTKDTGLLIGGMRVDGTVIDECLSWKIAKLGESLTISFARHALPSSISDMPAASSRFGAQLVPTPQGLILIGGITGVTMLTRHDEFINLSTGTTLDLEHQSRPLLTGVSAVHLGSSVIALLGGGATCFSFGTCWAQSCVISAKDAPGPVEQWQMLKTTSQPQARHNTDNHIMKEAAEKSQSINSSSQSFSTVPHVRLESQADFQELIRRGAPAILSGLDLGACTSRWSLDYLRDQVGSERRVVVHNSAGPHMDFQAKNFTYQTMRFDEFLLMVSQGSPVYLRALSCEKPADSATELAKDFPSIAPDFSLPRQLEYVGQHAHSSPLRISGPVNMWLHYDVMANVLCQIRGSKRLRLYAPESVAQMEIPPGASSSSINVWDESTAEKLRCRGVQGLEAHLNEGEVLFIPPLWLHAAQPTAGLSVAVNVFFRDERMDEAYAVGKDVYGNRDVAAYERGRRDVQRIARSFDGLPPSVQRFYLSRLAQELNA